MQITADELLAEAGQMALQVRLLEREVTRLAAENADLTERLAAGVATGTDDDTTS